ncbi:MAG TPA: hypothetical protein VJ754_11165, partial [Anaerolineae bacterium]|nr:hypothetical protein [Anaerolineae bacterium]
MTDRPAPDPREGSRLRRPDAWLLVVILFAFAIRLGSIDFQSLWRDEVDAIRFGRDLTAQIDAALAGGGVGGVLGKLRDTLTRPGFNGPLYFLALEQWSRLIGDTGFALRFFSTCFGVLAIPLTTILARRLLPTATAGFGTRINTDERGRGVLSVRVRIGSGSRLPLLAAWLMAISPYFVWYAQEAKM